VNHWRSRAGARPFCRFAPDMDPKTGALSEATKEVRPVLLNASDPYRAMLVDLPIALSTSDASDLGTCLSKSLKELAARTCVCWTTLNGGCWML
jgi:hypothetical protein